MTRAIAALIGIGCLLCLPVQVQAEAPAAPRYQVDPFWPANLPHNWMLGHVEGIVVDEQDHVWVLHHSSTMDHPHAHSPKFVDHSDLGLAQDPPISECCIAAPEVIEFDAAGQVVQAWGGHGHTPDWPEAVHGFWVDKQKNVWITGNHAPDRHALKFSSDGKKVLLKIGQFTENGGRAEKVEPDNQNTALLGGPTGLTVDDEAREVYIADGNVNKRIVVYDSETGAFKRGWGAYGIPLSEIDNKKNSSHKYDPAVPAKQFRVETVRIANDGLVYVSDKGSARVQVFTKAGKFIKEFFVSRETLAGPGTTLGMTFSRDPQQKYLFVADGSNNKIRILERDSGLLVGSVGRQGRNAGQFDTPLAVAVDSRGSLYVGEVKYNNRLQRFVLEK